MIKKKDHPLVKWAKRNKRQRLLRMYDFEINGVTHTLTIHTCDADMFLNYGKMHHLE